MSLNPGDTLQNGKYTIERRLREGLTSVSYLAKCNDSSRWVIKVLDPKILASLSDEKERNRVKSLFMQEAVKLARCSGTPHIVRSEWPFVEDELTCLPVEYLSGNSLAERPQPMLKESVALDYIRQVGDALSVVHKQGLVHRDIRPSKIFLRIEGSRVDAVLTGFDLAVDCDTALTRTRTRELVDGFSPYELYGHGRPVGAYTDVYSLAATLYELLTGTVPVSALERENKTKTLIPPNVKNPIITDGTVKAIEAGMTVWPTEDRPQSVAAWLKMLKVKYPITVQNSANFGIHQNTLHNKAQQPINWTKWSVVVALIAALAPVMIWLIDKFENNSKGKVSEPSIIEEKPDVDNPQVPIMENTEPKSHSLDTTP